MEIIFKDKRNLVDIIIFRKIGCRRNTCFAFLWRMRCHVASNEGVDRLLGFLVFVHNLNCFFDLNPKFGSQHTNMIIRWMKLNIEKIGKSIDTHTLEEDQNRIITCGFFKQK